LNRCWRTTECTCRCGPSPPLAWTDTSGGQYWCERVAKLIGELLTSPTLSGQPLCSKFSSTRDGSHRHLQPTPREVGQHRARRTGPSSGRCPSLPRRSAHFSFTGCSVPQTLFKTDIPPGTIADVAAISLGPVVGKALADRDRSCLTGNASHCRLVNGRLPCPKRPNALGGLPRRPRR